MSTYYTKDGEDYVRVTVVTGSVDNEWKVYWLGSLVKKFCEKLSKITKITQIKRLLKLTPYQEMALISKTESQIGTKVHEFIDNFFSDQDREE